MYHQDATDDSPPINTKPVAQHNSEQDNVKNMTKYDREKLQMKIEEMKKEINQHRN